MQLLYLRALLGTSVVDMVITGALIQVYYHHTWLLFIGNPVTSTEGDWSKPHSWSTFRFFNLKNIHGRRRSVAIKFDPGIGIELLGSKHARNPNSDKARWLQPIDVYASQWSPWHLSPAALLWYFTSINSQSSNPPKSPAVLNWKSMPCCEQCCDTLWVLSQGPACPKVLAHEV